MASRGSPRHKGRHPFALVARLGHVSAQFRVSTGRQPAAQDDQNLPSWLRNILTWGTYLRGCSFGLYRPILIPATMAGHVFCSVKNSGRFSCTIKPHHGLWGARIRPDFLKTSARERTAACLLRRGASDMRLFAAWGTYVAPP